MTGDLNQTKFDRVHWALRAVTYVLPTQLKPVLICTPGSRGASSEQSALLKDTTCGSTQGSNSQPWDHESRGLPLG